MVLPVFLLNTSQRLVLPISFSFSCRLRHILSHNPSSIRTDLVLLAASSNGCRGSKVPATNFCRCSCFRLTERIGLVDAQLTVAILCLWILHAAVVVAEESLGGYLL